MANFKNILIRGVNWIGDAVLTIPAINAVRAAFPEARISLLVKPWVSDIFRGNPDVNDIILYEDRFNSITGRFRLAKILRSKGFDAAILLQNAFDAAFIAWFAGIPERIGYKRDSRGMLLTKAVPVSEDVLKQHQVHYYLNLLKEGLNIDPVDTEPVIYLNEEEIAAARQLLNQTQTLNPQNPLIGINPGAAYGSAKRWMPERFAEVISRIVNELEGNVILFGSGSETEIANEILRQSTELIAQNKDAGAAHSDLDPDSSSIGHYASRILNMAGKTSLRELAALISECDAFITNDSGPMHMASALLVPVVAIFGSTDSAITGPLGKGHAVVTRDVSCSPCLKRKCPAGTTRSREDYLRCMTEITADDIYDALLKTLPGGKAVFFDRDGTLIEDAGYLNNFDDLKIFNGAYEDIQRLRRAGFTLIGITNQSGIARGIVTEDFVKASNTFLQRTLGMDDFYYCPHHPDDKCQCRKPKPRLLSKARLKHKINLKASCVVGDKTLDVLLAKAAGARGILVQTGHDRESEEADCIAKDLKQAVDWILDQERQVS
ncbi:MAG: lipopolysaccharide heptosyltransferase II [Nitrospirae bacterium]|nr:lipopolysaccharide heptosyltransferase II [Nitrospirota bacterium]